MDVYLLWHAHHSREGDGPARRQHTTDGRWYADEENGDDVKLLGVYSTRAAADARISRAQSLPGFQDEPDCFHAARATVDRDEWAEGYVTD